ncbi:hypothetical protein [Halofilum ochraceum]|uniref:hypothetical protein n=1 Tax=Halofilum ochraceum TaxID=1611323 RepID=UPI000831CA7F|nr:hypothetical protein [Halofilum ochraceum]
MTGPATGARRRGWFRVLRAGALAADAAYLVAWILSPAAVWAPWVIAAGLALGGALIIRALGDDSPGRPWPQYCLPLLLPCSVAAAAPRTGSRSPHARRIGLAVALTAIIATTVSGTADQRLFDPLLTPLDEPAAEYVDRALLQAGGTYVGARALERLLAVAGDISIGIGFVEGRPGQIFEPLRDLLDRFSTVVLAALASLTLQKVMLELGGDVALPLFASAAAALAVVALIAGPRRQLARSFASAAGLMLGTAVLLRLLLPLTGLGVAAIAGHVLEERQQAATATVERAAGQVGLDVDLDRAPGEVTGPSAGNSSLGERMGTLKDQAQSLQAVDQGWLDSLFNALIDLVAVFVIETLIAPLAVLFLLWRLWLRLAAGLRMPFDRDPAPALENR